MKQNSTLGRRANVRAKARRQRARAEGRRIYESGMPCIHQHPGERYVSNNACVKCQMERHQLPSLTAPLRRRSEARIRADLAQQLEQILKQQSRRWKVEHEYLQIDLGRQGYAPLRDPCD